MATTNMFIVESSEPTVKEKDTGIVDNRQKPTKLYEELISIFNKDKSLHVLDCCGGAGSCALACNALGLKCIVIEKSPFKNSLIIHEENTKKNHKRVVSLYVDKDFPSFT